MTNLRIPLLKSSNLWVVGGGHLRLGRNHQAAAAEQECSAWPCLLAGYEVLMLVLALPILYTPARLLTH